MYFTTFILKNLARRRVRTVLTVLGLAVAVGSVVTLLGVTDNVERAVIKSLMQRQVALVVQQAGRSSGLNSDFRETFVDRAREIEGVTAVASAVVDLLDVTRDSGTTDQVMIQGWRHDNFALDDLHILTGRKFEAGDQGVVLLGSSLAETLNKHVGDTVVFGDSKPLKVLGIFKSFVVFEDGGAVVPLEDAQKLSYKRITGFSIRVDPTAPDREALIQRVKEKVEALRDPEDPSVRLSAQTPESYLDSLSHIQLIRALSWMVAVVAVFIGVISMLNTMVMSVLERTQEIGILRAVGWPRNRVMRMVLGESVGLSAAAAMVGTLGAVAAIYLLTLAPLVKGFVEPGLSLSVIVKSVGLTAFMGLLGGAYPAFRAARLLPTEAIRHE